MEKRKFTEKVDGEAISKIIRGVNEKIFSYKKGRNRENTVTDPIFVG